MISNKLSRNLCLLFALTNFSLWIATKNLTNGIIGCIMVVSAMVLDAADHKEKHNDR